MAMAKVLVAINLILFSVVSSAKEFPEEIPSPDVVNAYKQYWLGFDAYEKKLIQKGQQKYQKSWLSIQEAMRKDELDYTKAQIEKLRDTIESYRSHIKESATATNLPYVYLNLAQVLAKVADLLETLGESQNSYRQEALAHLESLQKKFPDFAKKEDAQYLEGLLLSTLGMNQKALKTWEELARSSPRSLYGVQAQIAIGDFFFDKENAPDALKYYQAAEKLALTIDSSQAKRELLRIYYRIVWASYRSAKLSDTIETGIKLLQPGTYLIERETQLAVEADAVQLIGDALFENNDPIYTKATLKRKVIKDFASQVAMRVMINFEANGAHRNTAEIGEYILDLYPVSKVAPDILNLTAKAYELANQTGQRIATLEKLALFLPQQSLWRARHGKDFQRLRHMENLGESAALVVSEFFYDLGVKSGNSNYFASAATYYQILLDFKPSAPESDDYRLKRAHCAYFSDELEQAEARYRELIKDLDPGHVILKVASHQLVLTREKIWRNSYARASQGGKSPNKDPMVVQNLRDLEKAVEQFANRFPPKIDPKEPDLAVDTLLVAAAANRDQGDLISAERYWQRVLLANPNKGQRSIAIRSLVMAKVEQNDNQGIVAITRRFLELENWPLLGKPLQDELLGVLSKATLAYADELADKGENQTAGSLEVEIAKNFPSIPNREQIYRDGAYHLAIGGQWTRAEQEAQNFIDLGLKTYAADMAYLKARSAHYQLKFPEAARGYFTFAKQYPAHQKALSALERSEALAAADNQFKLAAEAAELRVQLSKNRADKLAILSHAYEYYEKAELPKEKLLVAQKRLNLAKSPAERLPARLALANAQNEIGQDELALQTYENISQQALSLKSRLDKKIFQDVYSEANVHLAEEARVALNDFVIKERAGRIQDRTLRKMRYFSQMVNFLKRAINTGHPLWSAKARYVIGMEAELIADEFEGLIREGLVSDQYGEELATNASRLKNLARSQFSANLLARSRNPNAYLKNVWVDKSELQIQGEIASRDDFKGHDFTPHSISLGVPQQWSL